MTELLILFKCGVFHPVALARTILGAAFCVDDPHAQPTGEGSGSPGARQLVSSSALGNLVESAPLFMHGEKDAVITIETGALSLFRSAFMAVLLHVETGLRQAGV